MGDYLQRVFSQISEFVGDLSAGKKIAMVGTGLGIAAALAAMFIWAGNTNYSNLMTNLSPDDANRIMRVLRDKKIPFRLDTTGKNLSIPPEYVDQMRLELATSGLPDSSVVGYEVFDKASLGQSSAVQKINQKRALEGEITRTINSIHGVGNSRVHLALPAKSAFAEDQKRPTAAVVVDLQPGTVLTVKQIYGIGNLVARAVEGMEVSDVVIVDSNGRTLSKNSSDPLAAATASQLDYEQKVEGDYEKRIEDILSRVVGEGHVVAKVTADLEFAQVHETQTMYDSDGSAVSSTEKHSDKMEMVKPAPAGVAGSSSNTPAGGAPNGDTKSNTDKNVETTSFKVPQTVRQTTKPTGTVKHLSVAVLVDGKNIKTTSKDGVVTSKNEAWSADKLKELEDLVISTVGIDKKRGDMLEVKNMEFTHEDFEEASQMAAAGEHKAYVANMINYGVIGFTIMMFFLFVVRPFVKWMTENTVESVDTFLPQTIEELERLNKNAALPGLEDAMPILPEKMDPSKVEGEMIREKIITLVDQNPHKAALILKDWLVEPSAAGAQAAAAAGATGGKSASA